MKTAILYYSLDGSCACTARILQQITGADLFEIKTVDTTKRRGLRKMAWGVFQVMSGRKPALQPLPFRAEDYDRIMLGAPVWAGAPAPAMAAFLSAAALRGKTLALYCCHRGGKGKALAIFRALVPGNVIAGELDLAGPAANPGKTRETLEAWLSALAWGKG
jgi:flavodoxin